jgi:hypothetical protein
VKKLNSDPKVDTVFSNYPNSVRDKMLFLRKLIIDTASENEDIDEIEETLKWGEPSFVTKHGSTLRIDWKQNSPDQYALYFQCTTRLVETFKMVFGKKFQYDGKRAIIFQLDDELPVEELKQCINATLNYHKVKSLRALGMG